MTDDPAAHVDGWDRNRLLQHEALTARDGVVLAANVYLPPGEGPWPTVICCYPYLKDLWFGPLVDNQLRYFADSGFATVIVDMRGTGASAGSKSDAFEAVEVEDAYDIVEETALKPWCNGKVGFWGLSYGGITAFRAATAQPPHLRAAVIIEGSTDPYRGEVMRYGAPGLAMICGEWSTWMLALNAIPPLAGTPKANDAEVWAEHLQALHPWHFAWRQHARQDDYWAGRSVDAGRIQVPTLIFTSWRDTNPWIWDDFQLIQGPKEIVCGPWQHGFPDEDGASPIHSFSMMAAWWRKWLTDDQGSLSATPIHVYDLGTHEWQSHTSWPADATTWELTPSARSILSEGGSPAVGQASLPQASTIGVCNGLGMASPPGDLQVDEDRSLVFTTKAVAEPVQVIGQIEATLELAEIADLGDIAIRVSAVAPSGVSTLVAKGFVRSGNVCSGTISESGNGGATIVVPLIPTCYTLLPGERLRVAVSRSDFPEIWPGTSPWQPLTLLFGAGTQTRIRVPVAPKSSHARRTEFAPPDPALRSEALDAIAPFHVITMDPKGHTATVEAGFHSQFQTLTGDPIECSHTFTVQGDDRNPDKTALTSHTHFILMHAGRVTRVEAETHANPQVASASVRVSIDGECIFAKVFRDEASQPGASS